jgi:hypothetical protein
MDFGLGPGVGAGAGVGEAGLWLRCHVALLAQVMVSTEAPILRMPVRLL